MQSFFKMNANAGKAGASAASSKNRRTKPIDGVHSTPVSNRSSAKVYVDNALNNKLGRVGLSWGSMPHSARKGSRGARIFEPTHSADHICGNAVLLGKEEGDSCVEVDLDSGDEWMCKDDVEGFCEDGEDHLEEARGLRRLMEVAGENAEQKLERSLRWQKPAKRNTVSKVCNFDPAAEASTSNSFAKLEDDEAVVLVANNKPALIDSFLKKYASATNGVGEPRKKGKSKGKTGKKKVNAPPIAYSRLAAKKLPPICVPDVDLNNFEAVKLALEADPKVRFSLKIGTNAFRIIPKSLDSHDRILESLKVMKLGSFSFTEKARRPRAFTVKGMPAHYGEDVVLEKFKKLALSDVEFIGAERLHTATSNRLGIPSNIYKVVAIVSGNVNVVTSIREIEKLSISIAPFVSNRAVPQCYRCQRIGHTATNCNMERRCVKCSRNHGRETCLATPANGKKYLKCALCSGNHCASAQVCLVRCAEIAKIKSRQLNHNNLKSMELADAVLREVNVQSSNHTSNHSSVRRTFEATPCAMPGPAAQNQRMPEDGHRNPEVSLCLDQPSCLSGRNLRQGHKKEGWTALLSRASSFPASNNDVIPEQQQNPASGSNVQSSVKPQCHQGHKKEMRTASLSSMTLHEEATEVFLESEVKRLFKMDIGTLVLRAAHYRTATDDDRRAMILNLLFNIH